MGMDVSHVTGLMLAWAPPEFFDAEKLSTRRSICCSATAWEYTWLDKDGLRFAKRNGFFFFFF